MHQFVSQQSFIHELKLHFCSREGEYKGETLPEDVSLSSAALAATEHDARCSCIVHRLD